MYHGIYGNMGSIWTNRPWSSVEWGACTMQLTRPTFNSVNIRGMKWESVQTHIHYGNLRHAAVLNVSKGIMRCPLYRCILIFLNVRKLPVSFSSALVNWYKWIELTKCPIGVFQLSKNIRKKGRRKRLTSAKNPCLALTFMIKFIFLSLSFEKKNKQTTTTKRTPRKNYNNKKNNNNKKQNKKKQIYEKTHKKQQQHKKTTTVKAKKRLTCHARR